MTDVEIMQLVLAAEERVLRFVRKGASGRDWRAHVKLWRLKRGLGNLREPRYLGPLPETSMGRVIQASAAYDFARARRLAEVDEEGGEAVLYASFSIAMRKLFPGDASEEELLDFALLAKAEGDKLPISAPEVARLIQCELGIAVEKPAIEAIPEMVMQNLLFRTAVDRLGLFSAEVAEMVRSAERSACY